MLLALSRPYLEMVGPDLMAWTPERRSRLRIFSGAPMVEVDPILRDNSMPYDSRFDAIGGPNPGTQADFAQRALRHFAEVILPRTPGGNAAEHAAAVEDALSLLTRRERPNRTKLTDQAIIALIQEHSPAIGWRSGPMLRLLRDQLDVACEQGRFKALFQAATGQGQLL
ncbi:MAG: hypothetical protein ACOYOB_20190 [Myxococcota bacterium]